VIDDYAHHPTEIAATLSALKKGWLPYQQTQSGTAEPGRLIVLFQPHRYTRTKELFSEFLTVFADADYLFLGEIYSAGEQPIPGITGEILAKAVQHSNAAFFADLEEALPEVVKLLRPGDIVVTMGAGSVTRLAPQILHVLKER